MCNKKMSDVYTNLPWREDGNVSFLYVEPEQNVMIAKSVNNHDRLTEENKQLRDALKVLIRSGEQLLNVEDIEDEEDAATIHSNFSDELVKADNLLNK